MNTFIYLAGLVYASFSAPAAVAATPAPVTVAAPTPDPIGAMANTTFVCRLSVKEHSSITSECFHEAIATAQVLQALHRACGVNVTDGLQMYFGMPAKEDKDNLPFAIDVGAFFAAKFPCS